VPGKPIEEVKRELGLAGEIVKLASNENSLGPSPLAIKAIMEELPNLWLYPDDGVFYLKRALSELHDIPKDWIVVGNGAVEIIHLLGQACLAPGDEAVMGKPAFMMYEIMSQMCDSKAVQISHPDYKNDLNKFGQNVNERTRLIWIDNPNNPTGTHNTKKEVDELIREVNSRALIILDEAYCQFVDEPDFPDGVEYVKQGKAVVALRTFSKVLGLAGIRCGYGIMHPDLARILDTLRINFSVNSLAQVAVLAALKDKEHMAKSRNMVIEGRKFFYENLDKLGLKYNKTQGNYIWIDFERDSREVNNFLLKEGIIIRPGWIFGAPTCARVSISRERDNAKFFKALKKALDQI
jgi:histidinol-phosphate aminotransferase